MSHDLPDTGFSRRRAQFLGLTAGQALAEAHDDTRIAANDPLEQAATSLVRSSLETHALTQNLPPIAGADMERMLSAAQHLMRGLPRHQLASLSPSSAIMQTLTAASFSIGMTAETQQRAQRLAQEQAAIAAHATTAEQARSGAGLPFGPHRLGQRSDAASGNASDASSSRFAALGGERIGVEVARQMQLASHEAIRAGIPWAVNKPELLKLGPAAVRAVADVNLQEPSYQRLITDAHFAPKDVVTLAEFAKVRGVADANKLAHATADVVQRGTDEAEQIRIKQSITGYMEAATAAKLNPADAAAQQRLEAAGNRQKETLTPVAARSAADYQAVKKYEDEAKVEQRFRATAATLEAKADQVQSTAAAATAKADADLQALLTGAPAPAAATPSPTPAPQQRAELVQPTPGAAHPNAALPAAAPPDAAAAQAPPPTKTADATPVGKPAAPAAPAAATPAPPVAPKMA